MKREDIDIEVNNWETLCPNADIAIEKLMTDFLMGGITPIEVFSRVREMEVDFYPDIDVATETLNSIIEFITATGVKENDAVKAYHDSQTEDMFQKLIRRNPNAKVKFYVEEYDGQDNTQWKYQDTEDAAEKQFTGHIKYFGENANNLTLYKALVQDLGNKEFNLLHEEVIKTHVVDK